VYSGYNMLYGEKVMVLKLLNVNYIHCKALFFAVYNKCR
jgi:hypothetical protein